MSSTTFSVKSLAELFGRSEDTIRRWKNEGIGNGPDAVKLVPIRDDPSVRHLCFSLEAVRDFTNANPNLLDHAPELRRILAQDSRRPDPDARWRRFYDSEDGDDFDGDKYPTPIIQPHHPKKYEEDDAASYQSRAEEFHQKFREAQTQEDAETDGPEGEHDRPFDRYDAKDRRSAYWHEPCFLDEEDEEEDTESDGDLPPRRGGRDSVRGSYLYRLLTSRENELRQQMDELRKEMSQIREEKARLMREWK